MGNRVFQSILDEKIELFRFAFERTSKELFVDEESNRLIHPGEFGTYREAVCKDFLRLIIPIRLEIGSGFLINCNEEISSQCDIIVYDKNSSPLIENAERQRFFPIETVCAIGEIKSDLNKQQFKEAINRLARNKKMRESIKNPVAIKREGTGKFDPILFPYDHIYSFLICNKLTFDLEKITDEIDTLYEADIEPWQRHNLILSVNDGLLGYTDDIKTLHYPTKDAKKFKNRFLYPKENKNIHFYYASSYIFMGTTSSSIYYPEVSDYIIHAVGGYHRTQIQ